MIAALAGRRIDPPNANPSRFPEGCIPHVMEAILEQLKADRVTLLVCAAACGADILALSAATELAVRRRIVLPFSVELFRERSVIDRPGRFPWAEYYDRFISEARSANDLVLLGFEPSDPTAYEKTNVAILESALSAASQARQSAEALAVWDAQNRTSHDLTEHFAEAARIRGMPVTSIGIIK
jgi:hypothetical protein